jgi:hypothetical protein
LAQALQALTQRVGDALQVIFLLLHTLQLLREVIHDLLVVLHLRLVQVQLVLHEDRALRAVAGLVGLDRSVRALVEHLLVRVGTGVAAGALGGEAQAGVDLARLARGGG